MAQHIKAVALPKSRLAGVARAQSLRPVRHIRVLIKFDEMTRHVNRLKDCDVSSGKSRGQQVVAVLGWRRRLPVALVSVVCGLNVVTAL